ncbi:MAG: TlpA disulfide reductase family protein [Mucilaginibacter sp.]
MKKLSLFLMAVLSIVSTLCYAQKMKPVIITGKVINCTEKTPKVFKFNFLDPLVDGSSSVEINELGEFRVQQNMLYTHNMTINYANYFINLYVQPRDSVHLTIDASLLNKPKFEWLTITGDNALIKTQLNLCFDYIVHLPYHKYDMTLAPKAMLSEVKQDYNRYLIALNEYASKNNLDTIVVNWAKTDIKFLISNTISDYGVIKEGSIADKQARISVFADSFFDMYNPENFKSMLFPYHLGWYVSYLKEADDNINEKTDTQEAILKKTIALILKLPAGECRDYMLYHHLKSFATKTPGILNSLKDLQSYFTKAIYYTALKKQTNITNKPAFPLTNVAGVKYLSANGVVSNIPKTDVFSYLAAKYPGKVLYVDVYATWCAPCLDEMRSTPALQKAMANKDVVFINLCLQSLVTNWKNLVKEKNIKGENYFLTSDASKLFMGTYKLEGYPSYILMNKQGQIVTTNASRPSDKKTLYKQIDKLL